MEGSSVNETVAILGNFKWGFILSLGVLLLSQWMLKQYQSIWTLAGIEDFTLGTLAFIGGTIINLMISLLLPNRIPLMVTLLAGILAMMLCNQYQSIWTLAGIEDFTLGTLAFIGGTIINLMISLLLPNRIPLMVTLLAGILAMMLCNGARIEWRLIRRTMMAYQNQRNGHQQRVLIYGAGMGGSLVANEYKRNPHLGKKVVGFIDDDQEKLGTVIGTALSGD